MKRRNFFQTLGIITLGSAIVKPSFSEYENTTEKQPEHKDGFCRLFQGNNLVLESNNCVLGYYSQEPNIVTDRNGKIKVIGQRINKIFKIDNLQYSDKLNDLFVKGFRCHLITHVMGSIYKTDVYIDSITINETNNCTIKLSAVEKSIKLS